ncbi:hypothetical protein HYQ46_003958 [Verticillium longisporum]|nr:hypothetical protein HYQ46_003958 [Verticillium longisporum]
MKSLSDRVLLSVCHPVVVHLAQALDPVLPQRGGHLAEDHGLVLVGEGLLGNLKLKVHVFVGKVAEEDVHGLLGPARRRAGLERLGDAQQAILHELLSGSCHGGSDGVALRREGRGGGRGGIRGASWC